MEKFKAGQTVFGVDGDDVREITLECDITEEEVVLFNGLDGVYVTLADAVYHIQKKALDRFRRTFEKTDRLIAKYYNL